MQPARSGADCMAPNLLNPAGDTPFQSSGERNEQSIGHTALHRSRTRYRGLQSRVVDDNGHDTTGGDAVPLDIVVVEHDTAVVERLDVVDAGRILVELEPAACVFQPPA